MSIENGKYVTKGIPVQPGASAPQRKELNDLSDEEMYLYLQGLMRFQSVSSDDPLSYYQIAGIHGLPYQTWPLGSGDISEAGRTGFCTHTSVLFLTWHRPFLSLYESRLYYHVNKIAQNIDPHSSEKAKYQQLAKDFRMPYWDWARREAPPFPTAALNSTAFAKNKDFYRNKSFQGPRVIDDSEVTVRRDYNPLFTFPFPAVTIDDIKEINFADRGKLPILRKYESTQRYPQLDAASTPLNVLQEMTNFYSAQSNQLSPGKQPDDKPRNIERNLSERVAYMLKAYQRFGPMCYNEYPGKGTGETGKAEIWGSIEDIHNWVHGLIGDKGHMGQVPKSAFDPIFWLHHTNIDRLFAIWQALHESGDPVTYVTSQQAKFPTFAKRNDKNDDIDTPLWPFRATSDANGWWTSQTVRRTETFGYAYPETVDWKYSGTPDARTQLRKKIDDYYSNLPRFISLSKARVPTAGASLLPQAALLKKIEETSVTANVSEMRKIDAELPKPEVLLKESLKPEKPFLRDLAPNGKYLEWLVNVKAEKHALGGDVQVHVFLGPVQEQNVKLWAISPNHVGAFVTLGQDEATGCEKCQQDQADHTQVTGQIPLTLALTERYLAQLLPDLSEDSVIPYLKQNLHWRVTVGYQEVIDDKGSVPGLKVFVVSNEVTVPEDPNAPPTYAQDVKIYPEITTKENGEGGRGEGSGLTVREL